MIWLDEDVEKDERKRSSKTKHETKMDQREDRKNKQNMTKKRLDKVLFFNQIKLGYKKIFKTETIHVVNKR